MPPWPKLTVALKYLAASIQTGPFGSQLHAEDYSTGGRPVVNPAHLMDGRIKPDFEVAVDEETFARLAQHELLAGDVVIGRRGELGRCGVVEADQEGWLCGTGSIRLRPDRSKLEPRWLRWLLTWTGTRDWLSLASVGTTMENLGAEVVGGMPVPAVETSAQRAIADFLDRETARLDSLVAAKERMLKLLVEKRQALITRAVTRGLDSTVPLRDSGIPWLGEIPSHWTVKLLKRVVMFQRGHDLPQEQREAGEIPVVSSGGIIDWHNVAVANAPGIVTGRYGSIGEFVFVDTAYWPLNTALYSIDLYDNVPRFCWYMLQSLAHHFIVNSMKSAVPGVDRNDIHSIQVTVPPLDEQYAIVAHIDRQTAKLDAVRAATERTITLLNERRLALVAAAVTGQIDVDRTL